jgi:phospholipid/cholesterol/gamma-HCH transport system substrate-binding protein
MSPWIKTPEFKVGLLVLVVSGIIGAMSLKVSESSGFIGGKKLWFNLENAAGLIKNGSVHVAGIRVGVIEKISLDDSNGQARIDVVIQPGVRLSKSSKIQIRPNGILGDKHIEIIPGNMTDPELANGDKIEGVEDSASLDKVLADAGKVAKSLVIVADNLRDATEGDPSKPLGKILKNIESLSGDLADIVRDKKGEVREIIDNVHSITENLDEVFGDDSENGFKQTAKRVMARLDNSMKNIDEISTRINEGKGTIGKLINDEEMVDSLDAAVTTYGNLADVFNKTDLSIEANSNYLERINKTRTYFGVRLQPALDRFYELGLVSTPDGPEYEKTTTTVTDGNTPVVVNEKTVYENKYKITALFGKNFYNFGIKAGVIQNTGGVGLEYWALRRQLKVGIDAFDFEDFKLRPYIRYNIVKGIYIQGGGEDMTDSANRSFFIGGGVLLTSDDLKALISRVNL